MNEQLKEIFESSVLSDEVKTQLTEAFDSHVQKAVSDKEVELAEQFETQKEEMANMAIEMMEEAVSDVPNEIQDELAEARSLDIRYAIKMEEFKEEFAEAKSKEMEKMAESVIREELDELRESLQEAEKNIAGQKMFEAFKSTYGMLVEDTDQGEDLTDKVKELEEQVQSYKRKEKMDELLEGIGGRQRNIIKTLLENVETDRLEERFQEVSAQILTEDKGSGESENQLNENDKSQESDSVSGTVVLEEEQGGEKQTSLSEEDIRRWKRQAGILR